MSAQNLELRIKETRTAFNLGSFQKFPKILPPRIAEKSAPQQVWLQMTRSHSLMEAGSCQDICRGPLPLRSPRPPSGHLSQVASAGCSRPRRPCRPGVWCSGPLGGVRVGTDVPQPLLPLAQEAPLRLYLRKAFPDVSVWGC